jgi:hypothetical protein
MRFPLFEVVLIFVHCHLPSITGEQEFVHFCLSLELAHYNGQVLGRQPIALCRGCHCRDGGKQAKSRETTIWRSVFSSVIGRYCYPRSSRQYVILGS